MRVSARGYQVSESTFISVIPLSDNQSDNETSEWNGPQFTALIHFFLYEFTT